MLFRRLCAFGVLLPLSGALAPTRLLYEFPNNTFVENLAVRARGSILLTLATSSNLYMIDPRGPPPLKPTVVHHFGSAEALLGITETTPDTFQVVAANLSFASTVLLTTFNRIFTVAFQPGSNATQISLAASLPDALFLNGLATLNPTTVLAADSAKGVVWAVNVTTGESRIVLSDPLMASRPPALVPGINGLKVHGSTLYFTNSVLRVFAKIEINADGTAAGNATVIARPPTGGFFDDFTLDRHGHAFLATNPGNSIEEVGTNGEPQVIIAGNINSTEIAEPTSAQFGRTAADRKVLYVTTAGGLAAPVNGHEIIGGQVIAVDLTQGRD